MRWASIKPFDDKFPEDSTHQKSLKSVNFSHLSYWKNKDVATFLGHSVYIVGLGWVNNIVGWVQ